MKLKSLIGKEYKQSDYGNVLVTGVPMNSRKFVNIKCIQRKPGWHEQNKRYEPVKRVRLNPDGGPGAVTIHYDLYRNDEYGMEDTVHVNTLEL